jgi:orotate phosphoribosyltransferase
MTAQKDAAVINREDGRPGTGCRGAILDFVHADGSAWTTMPPALLNLFAVRNGHFLFESGHHGNLWLDLDSAFTRPTSLKPFVRELAQRLAAHSPDAVCGPATGGAVLARAVASAMGLQSVSAERLEQSGAAVKYRIPAGNGERLRGQNVVVVDDAINAGSAVKATLAEVQAWGATPVAIGALLVLGKTGPEFFAARRLPLECIAELPNTLWTPEECPLCAAGVPVEIPERTCL